MLYIMEEQYTNKTYAHDRFLAKTVLKLIPSNVTPNEVTMARFIMTPLVVWLIWVGHYAWGVPFFLLAAFTDMLDGSMARTRGQITQWGIVFDPIADKLLVGSVLIVLVIQKISFYLGIVIVSVETVVALAGLYSLRRNTVFMANALGKAKMNLQVAGLFFLIISVWVGLPILHSFATIVLATSVAFSLANIVAFGLRRAI
jgi:CDP-diacylglycerol--glycerol-3-phosphate 3-phosphatidyltransferase